MKLVFLTNYLNHHQVHLADELYRLLGEDYKFLSYEPLSEWRKQGGYSEISRPYLLKVYEDKHNYLKALSLVNNADVVIIGSAPQFLVHKRLQNNKITFHYNERWFKQRLGIRALSPSFWYFLYKNHLRYNQKRSYMLCASAFTASDVNSVFAYRGKCYKWGYFTKVEDLDIDSVISSRQNSICRMMWCSRFIKLKHPELPILLAQKLKMKGYHFIIDMFGSGDMYNDAKELTLRLNVQDVVHFRGSIPNQDVLNEMKQHHIFLFTSDRNEGWGAVLNEAMSNGCAVIASSEIGSVPFLINDGQNGCVFKANEIDSLVEKAELLLSDVELRDQISREAYKTMHNIWSPKVAAEALLELIECIESGNVYNKAGKVPCAIAE